MSPYHLSTSPIFYVQRGRGTPLLLIHGAGGNHLVWPAALRQIPGAAIYALDLPGHGRSSGAGRERVEDYAADVVSLMDGLGLPQAVLLGHSMGGAVAQMVALEYPGRVAGLALVGSGARLRVAPAILEGIGTDFTRVVDLLAAWGWGAGADPRLVAAGRRMMLRSDPQVLLGDFRACDRFDVRERAGEISAPTVAITGAEDVMTPLKYGQWLAEHIPGARFVLIPGAGHMVMMERPAEVAAAIRSLL